MVSIRTTLLALSFLSFTAACAPAGYYDTNGEYRAYGASDSFNHNHAMAGTPDTGHMTQTNTNTTTVIYDRVGDYDSNGTYIVENAPRVPYSMMPPKGMCRVWYTDRPYGMEPSAQPCNMIHVPDGAYVIYGG